MIGTNSVVNKSVEKEGKLLMGAPTVVKKDIGPWYANYEVYMKRVKKVMDLLENYTNK